MKLRSVLLVFSSLLLMTPCAFAAVLGGDDFDPGGLDPTTRVLSPDNTARNGRFSLTSSGSFFDYFGIATIDIDGLGDSVDLPFDVVDQSLVWFSRRPQRRHSGDEDRFSVRDGGSRKQR